MKTLRNIALLLLIVSSFSTAGFAQKKDKREHTVRTFYKIFDNGNLEDLDKVLSPKLTDHDAGHGEGSHFERMRMLIGMVNDGFTNAHHELEQIHLIGNDMIVVRWKMTGKHTGNFLGIPGTNKDIDFNGHDIFKIKNGVIVESWHVEELLGLIEQLAPQGH